LLNKSADDKQYKSGLNGPAGDTKLVELMPLKKDSMSVIAFLGSTIEGFEEVEELEQDIRVVCHCLFGFNNRRI
jgi:hypothetical protein